MSFRANNLKYFYFILSASALALLILIAYNIREKLGEKKKEVNESTPPPSSSKTPTDQNPYSIHPSKSNKEKLPEKIVNQETEEEQRMKEMYDWVIDDLQKTKPGESILKKYPVKNKINEEGVEKTTRLKGFNEEVLVINIEKTIYHEKAYRIICLAKLKEIKKNDFDNHDKIFQEAFESIHESKRQEAFRSYSESSNNKNGADWIKKSKRFDLLLPILAKYNHDKYQELIDEYGKKELTYKIVDKEFIDNYVKEDDKEYMKQYLLNAESEEVDDFKKGLNEKSREEFFGEEKERLELKYTQFRDKNKKQNTEKEQLEKKIYNYRKFSEFFEKDFYFTFTDKDKEMNYIMQQEIQKELSEPKNQSFLDKIIEFFDHLKDFKNLKDNLEFFNSNLDYLKQAFENDRYDFDSQKTKDGIKNLENILKEYNNFIINLKNNKNILKTKNNQIILYDYQIDDDAELENREDYKNLLKITEKQRELLKEAQKQVIDLNLPISFFAQNERNNCQENNISNQIILNEIIEEQEQKNPNPNPNPNPK